MADKLEPSLDVITLEVNTEPTAAALMNEEHRV